MEPQSPPTNLPKPLRLWPGVVAAAMIVVLRILMPAIFPETGFAGMIAALAGTLAIIVWWLFFSRAPWPERIGAIVVMVAAVFATRPFLHRSITNGMMGFMFPIYAVPVLVGPAFVASVVAAGSVVTSSAEAGDKPEKTSELATIAASPPTYQRFCSAILRS